MRVLFQSEQLNYRGTTNSIVDYAYYNQEILGNESVLIYNKQSPVGIDVGSEEDVIENLSKKFQVLTYDGIDNLNDIASKFDLCYSQTSGMTKNSILFDIDKTFKSAQNMQELGPVDTIVKSTRFGVHVVFQWYGPYGDAYAYISEWLSEEMKKNHGLDKAPNFVPYIVELPKPTKSLREQIGIPKDKFIIGRIGGYATFDLPFVWTAIEKILSKTDKFVFLFANTMPFYNHPNIINVRPFFDQQTKSNFIHTCDAMLHGRNLGESFGLSICEFLHHNKPVIAWDGGFDQNHVSMLKKHDLLYTKENVMQKIIELPDLVDAMDYTKLVKPYSPKNVMKQFNEVFLNGKTG